MMSNKNERILPMAADAATYQTFPSSSEFALSTLDGRVADWFREHFGRPTRTQRLAWPILSHGDHLLLAAPTGSGKTLAAFLPILSQLLTDESVPGLRCIFVVPLKALANDLLKNLRRCVEAVQPESERPLRVELRTGDVPSGARRKLYESPPAILITTPESLAVMLAQPTAVPLFQTLRWIVADEVHSLVANKRGSDLSISMERLESIVASGRDIVPIQRIGLSATCSPLSEVASLLVGANRSCKIAEAIDVTEADLTVECLPDYFANDLATAAIVDTHTEASDASREGLASIGRGFLARLILRLDREFRKQRTTLIFTDVRSLAESMTWLLRRAYPHWEDAIAVHHSALSAGRRRFIETKLKEGELRVVVSSTSLELGIDIGTIDSVVLIHAPRGVSRLLQRVGRAGHRPGAIRRGLILTAHPNELLEAAITVACSHSSQLEPLRVLDQPFDVLCQHLVGMACRSWWHPDDAYQIIRRAYPYRKLQRSDFDACLDYLTGTHRDGSEWLLKRLRWQGGLFSILNRRTSRLVLRNLGTILGEDMQPVRLRTQNEDDDQKRKSGIGEVDQTFADRLEPGDRFLLDGRCLEFRGRDGSDLVVEEVIGRPLTPRWMGTGWWLSPELARRVYLYRIQAAEWLREGRHCFASRLAEDLKLVDRSIETVAALIDAQESISEIPDQSTCLIECVDADFEIEYYLHTPLNRPSNDALGRVVALRLLRRHGILATWTAIDLGLMISIPAIQGLKPEMWRDLFNIDHFYIDLDRAIRESVSLRQIFRRVAFTGLMLLRNPLGKRRRVGGKSWAERRLFDQLHLADPNFVLIRQAVDEMKQHTCDGPSARSYLESMPRLSIRCRYLPRVSPLAAGWMEAVSSIPQALLTASETAMVQKPEKIVLPA